MSFVSSMSAERGVVGGATFWQQEGTAFPAFPAEDVLTPASGQNTADGIQAGENLTAPFADALVGVNGYAPSYNVFLKYQHEDGSAVRLLAARSALYLQRTHRQSFFVNEPQTQRPYYASERFVVDLEKRWGKTEESGQVTFRPSLILFGHEMRSQAVMPPFYASAASEGTSVIYAWSGRDLRLGPTLEYAIETPQLGIFSQTALVVGLQAEYDVASDYRINQCFLDRDGRFQPSVYLEDGGSDIFCVESLMLREGLNIDAFGTVREIGPAAGSATATSCGWAASSS